MVKQLTFKLKTKILFFFAIFIVLIVALSAIIIHIQKKVLENTIIEQNRLLANEVIKNIENYIFDKIDDFNIYFQRSVIYESEEQTPENYYNAIIKQLDGFYNMFNTVHESGLIEQLIIVDNKNTVIYSYNEDKNSFHVHDYDIKQAKIKGRSISGIEFNSISGNPIISIIIRLANEKKMYMGSVVTYLNAGHIFKEAEISYMTDKTLFVQLIDNTGKLLYSSKPYEYLEDISHMDYFKQIRNDEKIFKTRQYGKKLFYVVADAKRLTIQENIHWHFLIGFEEREVLKPINDLQNLIIVFTFLFVTVGIILTTIFSKHITRPLALIANATKQVSNGDFTTEIVIRSNDEIGELAVDFNKMVKNLKDLYHRIENHTNELELINQKLFKEIRYRKRVESTLNESKIFLEILLETIPNPIFYKDSIGVYLGCNKAFEDYLSMDRHDIIGKTIFDLFPEDQAKTLFNKDIELFNNPGTQIYEVALQNEAADIKNVILYNATFNDYNNNVAGIIGIILDITERKKYENFLKIQKDISYALASISNLTQGLNELLKIVLRMNELDNGCLYFIETENQYLKMISHIGFNEEFINNASYLDRDNALTIDIKIGMAIYMENFDKQEIHEVFESVNNYKFLCILPISYSRKVIGALVLASSQYNYISDNTKIMIENISSLLGEIFARIIAENDKKEYMKKLAKSNEELEQFAYIASHDLQEPLRKVMTYGDFLKEEYSNKMDKDGQYYINTMIKASSRMSKLINNLLEYSRITTKGDTFKLVRLYTILEDALDNLEIKIKEKNATIDYHRSHAVLKGDANQLTQLFQNIISNSLKYIKDDVKPVITITEKKRKDDMLEVSISDNGIGFDEKYLEKIFLPFQRLHSKNKYEGTGIGLAICNKIVTRHNGEIIAKSRLEEGSTFTIALPYIKAEQ